MKTCFKCQRTLSTEAFYRHPQMGDGRLGKCKDCTKADVSIRYRITRPQRQAYERQRNQAPSRRAAKAEYQRQHRARYPEHDRARRLVNYAVRTGRLLRLPCEVCGNPRSEAHHPDHSRPLDVRWLCTPHHREAEAA